ncbi:MULTISPECIES: hypothetical protein [Streptomyces]|uniref:hypothetical protein n=1 Tax=Streptomyces TaxID=1883 RepID=UPI0036A7520A
MTIDPQYPLTGEQADAEAARLIREAYRPEPAPLPATSFRDHTPVPAIGPTPPVPQPDSRIVPAWAAGIAVASIGVGAGVTGLGCGAWLVLRGLSSVTLLGVLAIAAPFAGIAMVATAVSAALSRIRRSSTTNVYQGTVIQRTEITSTAKGLGARSRIGGAR